MSGCVPGREPRKVEYAQASPLASGDRQAADDLLEHGGVITIMLAQKACYAHRIPASFRNMGAFANIPPKTGRRAIPEVSTWRCRARNLIERFFSKLKKYRRVASRYDKLAENVFAMVQRASLRRWLCAMLLQADICSFARCAFSCSHCALNEVCNERYCSGCRQQEDLRQQRSCQTA